MLWNLLRVNKITCIDFKNSVELKNVKNQNDLLAQICFLLIQHNFVFLKRCTDQDNIAMVCSYSKTQLKDIL